MSLLNNAEFEFNILDVKAKSKSMLKNKKKILFSYSGGKDSDIMLNLFERFDLIKKVTIIFFDTGLEWNAQIKHIEEMKLKGFDINIIKAYKPVSLCAKQYGQPFINKYVSEMLERLQKHKFNFKMDGSRKYNKLILLYPKCLVGLRWWCNYYGSKFDKNLKNQKDYKSPRSSSFNIDRNKNLKNFLLKYGLPFKVSGKCCYYAKKMTSHKFEKQFKPELIIHGVRKSEGGIRARIYKNCFVENKKLYMPLFWWNNKQIQIYKDKYNIKLSECYAKYGLKRTGCAGCPFGKNLDFEREQLKKFEPNLSLGIENIFKSTYEWTEKYNNYK